MQKVLVHVAMVLLGATLTVGFYEGRRLVKNTAKALDAATTLSSTGGRHAAREGLAGDGEADDTDADLEAAGVEGLRPRRMRVDPGEVSAGRMRVRPQLAAEGALGEPPDPRGRRRGGRGGGGGRRGAKAGLRSGDPAAAAIERLDELEARGEIPPDGAEPAAPAAEDTAAP